MVANLTSPVVSVTWLYEHLEAENLVVLDGTVAKIPHKEGLQIPKARFFDIKQAFSDTTNAFPNAFPTAAQFETQAQTLGINTNNVIVVYDDKGIYSSARVWYMFKAFGFNHCAVLNGGFPEWQAKNYPTVAYSPYNGGTGNFKAVLQPNHILFFDDIQRIIKSNTHKIIDARSADRFNCNVPEPRAGLRRGTIPNSINLPFTDVLENGKLKSKKAIAKALYMVADHKAHLVFSCGSGITACVLALGAELSGYKNIAVYDGSWTEYGALTHGNMEAPKTWTKHELLAYILIYVAHLDVKETPNERDYILSRVDMATYSHVLEQFKKDTDYQSIQNIIAAVTAQDYLRNDLADLFADIKLMAFADGAYQQIEQATYNTLKKILKHG